MKRNKALLANRGMCLSREPAASSRNRNNQRGVKRKISSHDLRRHSDYEVTSIAASPAAESPEIASGMDLSTVPSQVLV